MCNANCCESRSPIAKRMAARRLLQLEEEERRKPKQVVPTPQSLLYDYDTVAAMAQYIIDVTHIRPRYGLICGKFLSPILALVEQAVIIPYANIPKFPVSDDPENACFLVGYVMGAPIIALSNRFLSYEGHTLATCALPVHVMRLCGVKTIMLTCAAASVHPSYCLGDIMLIEDHINIVGMMHHTAMQGPSDPRFGCRFLPMVNAYDRELLKKAQEIGKAMGIDKSLRSGIFACMGGPVYETLAEERLLRSLGVDAVGMSVIPEVIAARQGDLKVFSFAIITVLANDRVEEEDPDADPRMAKPKQEVLEVPWQKVQACTDLIGRLLYYMDNGL